MECTKHSLASVIAHKISDLSNLESKNNVFEEISLYGDSNKDGSCVFSFEWHGDENAHEMGNKVLSLLHDIKKIIVGLNKETVEQEPPRMEIYSSKTEPHKMLRALYRFRAWDERGTYEELQKQLVGR